MTYQQYRDVMETSARIYAAPPLKGVSLKVSLDFSLHRFPRVTGFTRPKNTIAEIQHLVASYFRIRVSELVSARRSRDVVRPRQIAMYLCRRDTHKSLPDIGRRFGDRDHTTVIHAIRTIERLRKEDSEIDCHVRTLTGLMA